eukprot:7170765-Lingulodinium_polyedra.AAC.1
MAHGVATGIGLGIAGGDQGGARGARVCQVDCRTTMNGGRLQRNARAFAKTGNRNEKNPQQE